MIKLTVALPIYNMKNIAWLPMESLIRQKNIDFEWELVIAEEQNGNEFGKENIYKFESKLNDVGCTKIKYIQLKNWIPLAEKWRLLGINSDKNSEVFLCNGADNYNEPNRLKSSYDKIIKDGYDFISETNIYFYSLYDDTIYLRAYAKKNISNYSFKTEYARLLPISDKRKKVDRWVYKNVKRLSENKGNFKFGFIKDGGWKRGFNTHGFHTLSFDRYDAFQKNTKKFSTVNIKEMVWPDDVVERLQKIKNLAIK